MVIVNAAGIYYYYQGWRGREGRGVLHSQAWRRIWEEGIVRFWDLRKLVIELISWVYGAKLSC